METDQCSPQKMEQFKSIFKVEQILQKVDIHSSYISSNSYPTLEKLKAIIFDQSPQDQKIEFQFKTNPLFELEQILIKITHYCDQNVKQIVNPMKEQMSIYKKRQQQYHEIIQKYQQKETENDFLKSVVEDYKQKQEEIILKLNQSYGEMERSKHHCELQYKEKQMAKTEEMNRKYENLKKQNQELKKHNLKHQKEIISFKEEMRSKNYELECFKEETKIYKANLKDLKQHNETIEDKNQMLIQNIQEKEQFMQQHLYRKNYMNSEESQINYYVKDLNKQYQEKEMDFHDFHFNSVERRQNSPRQRGSQQGGIMKFVFLKSQQKDNNFIENQGNFLDKQLSSYASQRRLYYDENRFSQKKVYKDEQPKILKSEKKWYDQKAKPKQSGKRTLKSNQSNRKQEKQGSEKGSQKGSQQMKNIKRKISIKLQRQIELQKQVKNLEYQLSQMRVHCTEMQGDYQNKLEQLRYKIEYYQQLLRKLDQENIYLKKQNEDYLQTIDNLTEQIQNKEKGYKNYKVKIQQKCLKYIQEKKDDLMENYRVVNEKIETMKFIEYLDQSSLRNSRNTNNNLVENQSSQKQKISDLQLKQEIEKFSFEEQNMFSAVGQILAEDNFQIQQQKIQTISQQQQEESQKSIFQQNSPTKMNFSKRADSFIIISVLNQLYENINQKNLQNCITQVSIPIQTTNHNYTNQESQTDNINMHKKDKEIQTDKPSLSLYFDVLDLKFEEKNTMTPMTGVGTVESKREEEEEGEDDKEIQQQHKSCLSSIERKQQSKQQIQDKDDSYAHIFDHVAELQEIQIIQKVKTPISEFILQQQNKNQTPKSQKYTINYTQKPKQQTPPKNLNDQTIVVSCLPQQERLHLINYIKKHRVSLEHIQTVRRNYKQPQKLKHYFYLFYVTQINEDNNQDYFLLNTNEIISLKTRNKIIIKNRASYITEGNFMFGQSQINVNVKGQLVFNRNNKKEKLMGDIEDGRWKIKQYIKYKIRKNY